MTQRFVGALLAAFGLLSSLGTWAGNDRPTEYTNRDSVVNTRHNFTFRSQTGADLLSGGPNAGGAVKMDDNVTNYGEICVYCHTPHGANAALEAPLWNRVLQSTTYTTYNQLGTSSVSQTYSQPGAASLPCLSCHDGQQAIDAILNMPGPGRYSATPTDAFLDTFRTAKGMGPGLHSGLSTPAGDSCMSCHAPGTTTHATDFTVFLIGTDLRNDHPIGVTYPTANGPGTDWNTPGGVRTIGSRNTLYFDTNGDNKMQKDEIRLYDSGAGAEVECASCHDPHGVPSAGAGSAFNPTFLRKSNSGSAVCLTCHTK